MNALVVARPLPVAFVAWSGADARRISGRSRFGFGCLSALSVMCNLGNFMNWPRVVRLVSGHMQYRASYMYCMFGGKYDFELFCYCREDACA
ncbi:hypothetical protein [Mycobacteroides abscessus]|uniref:hypothetical protein n=1 Tax=Mycobacteroides abscessus TaxID=36809 RepID=UPI0019268750|nr:hypothetical protein [Mycobacteroides abscessus]MBL3752904.1 hypothetical protein [Mycobacteroides abscessus subsp. massiliense]